MNRREFLALAAAGQPGTLYDRSIVVDALCLTEWKKADIAAWRASGYTAIHTSLSNRNFRVGSKALSGWRRLISRNSGTLLSCRTAADITRAKRDGKLAVMLGFQNGTVIEDNVRNLDRLHTAGARCIQLTYNARNLIGDGCTERTNAGLSDFGIECVHRMNELGMVVDLSHCGQQTAADAIAFSRQPPAFTHTMCKGIYDHVRAKSDGQLRAISDKGGMTGIVALGYFIGPTAATTFNDYLNHLGHAINVCGIDHVGLATDFSIRGIDATATRANWYKPRLEIFKPSYRVRWPPWIAELDKPERFRTVADALAKRGYRASEIEKILGANWVRYFREVFGG